MPPLPRGTCPVCKGSIPIRVNGAAREHRPQLHKGFYRVSVTSFGPHVQCPGSGKMVMEFQKGRP